MFKQVKFRTYSCCLLLTFLLAGFGFSLESSPTVEVGGLPGANLVESSPQVEAVHSGPADQALTTLVGVLNRDGKKNIQRVAGMLDKKSRLPYLSRKPASVTRCDCCQYSRSAVYGEKYDSDGRFVEEGTQPWCRTNDFGKRQVASVNSGETAEFIDREKSAAIRALDIHIAAIPMKEFVIRDRALSLYKDLTKYSGSSGFDRASRELVAYSKGIVHQGKFNEVLFKKTWKSYREVVKGAPKKFIENPPSTILAYQEFFEAIKLASTENN